MLTQDNFTKENIERLQKISGNDPSLLEKTVYAFGLLEAISKVGMPFIFKGGICFVNTDNLVHTARSSSARFPEHSAYIDLLL